MAVAIRSPIFTETWTPVPTEGHEILRNSTNFYNMAETHYFYTLHRKSIDNCPHSCYA